jgi:hypothetical protein
MGLLIDGRWHDQWYDTSVSGGRFVRRDRVFRNWVLIGVGSRRRSASQAIDLPTGGGVTLGRLFTDMLREDLSCLHHHRSIAGLHLLIDGQCAFDDRGCDDRFNRIWERPRLTCSARGSLHRDVTAGFALPSPFPEIAISISRWPDAAFFGFRPLAGCETPRCRRCSGSCATRPSN